MSLRIVLLTLSALPALLMADGLREPLESRMAVHMLLLLIVAAAGWAFARALSPRAGHGRFTAAFDTQAVFSLTTASCVFAFWMLPLTLDLSLLWPSMSLAKYLSLWLSGGLLALGSGRMSAETLTFFSGNAVLMLSTTGLLYLEADTRLCLSYRMDDQLWAGIALLLTAAVLGLSTLTRLIGPGRSAIASFTPPPQDRRNPRPAPRRRTS